MQCDDWKIEESKWKCMKLENQAVGSVRFVCVCVPDDVNGNHMRCTFQMCLVNASNLKFGTKWQSNRNFNELTFCWQPKGILSSFAPFNGEHSFQSFPTHTTGNWLVMMAVCCLQLQNVCPDCFLCCHPIEPESFETRLFSLHWKWNIPEPERFDIHTRKNCTPTRKKRDKNIGIVLRHLNGCVSMWLAAIWPRIQAKRMHQCGFCSRSDGGKNEK